MITDYTPFLDLIFKHVNIDDILEFGCGEGTKFLAKHCERIRSVELACKQDHLDWFKIVSEYKIKNWNGTLYRINDQFDMQMNYFISNELDKEYDLIFIDPGVHCRAEIVNLCFGKADIIIAHDTNHGAYGWEKVDPPSGYVRVDYKEGSGTTLWTKYDNLANKLDK